MKSFRKVIWLLIIPIVAFGIHKHYISLTKVDYIKEKKVVQITMKFFLDDIELALENRMQQPMELATKNENKLAGKYLETYVRQKFKIWINNKEMVYTYLGKEYEDNEVFFYLELKNIDHINSIEVENSLLFETFEEQQNYVKLNLENVQKTFILVKANAKEMLKL
jgi:hypothetical protein